MQKAWNAEGKYFAQSYEDTDVLDSAVLIMPLVFFMHGACIILLGIVVVY
jgi:GH15 family glucan-1,4-alpha-glucosidase